MAYYVIWTPEDQEHLVISMFVSKDDLYSWLHERDVKRELIDFATYSTDAEYDFSEDPLLFVADQILVIKGKSIRPDRKKVAVLEWWVE